MYLAIPMFASNLNQLEIAWNLNGGQRVKTLLTLQYLFYSPSTIH
jgi:hypothetical protein